ncbi:TraK family protein [Pseudovibrio ascidiaceicola]|uniref:TraK family protein n=1 Tax=Pseudovibrio ascidiaceicola TaxID=285279 RepID=UPI003D35C5E1
MALPWGDARAQFQLVRAHVETEIGRGVSTRTIFEALLNEGKINMAKKTFYKYAAKALNPKSELAPGSAIVPPPKTRRGGSNTPQDSLLQTQPKATNRFTMADSIKDYD